MAGAAFDPVTRPLKAIYMFFDCLIASLHGSDFKPLVDRFDVKVALLWPPVFPVGVMAGAAAEIGRIAKQIAHIVAHPVEFLEEIAKVLKLLWSPQAMELGCAMGNDMADELKKGDMESLVDKSDHEFVYQIGYLVGPLVLNTLLSFVAPEVVGAIKGLKVFNRFLEVLESMRGELKFLEVEYAGGRGRARRSPCGKGSGKSGDPHRMGRRRSRQVEDRLFADGADERRGDRVSRRRHAPPGRHRSTGARAPFRGTPTTP